ncbi:MAG: alpha-hydroxy-acid oxidizing protein [Spirochaetia bacterium]|nr:alpha-hydroxy-acid oxidizing protein [Spirochaetia bacterium]
MASKGIVILGAGLLQTPLILKAKSRGWLVIVADQNKDARGVKHADIFIKASTNDANALIAELKTCHARFHYCCTIGTDMTRSVAAVNEAFHLGGLTSMQAQVTTNKGKMRTFLANAGLKQPAFYVSNDKNDTLKWAIKNNSGNGYVIKPVHNMGARGVMFFKNPHELAFAFEFAQSQSSDGEIIIEEYIKADELSVDALCYAGETYITGLADRNIELKDGRFFIETGHTMPAQKTKTASGKILLQLNAVARALSLISENPYTGALKGDIRVVSKDEIIIGEIATRLSGGFMSTHTYPYSSDNDLLDAYLDILENKLPQIINDKLNEQYHNVTLERALLTKPGLLEKIEIPETLNCQNAHVRNVFIHYRKGDYISSLQSNLGKPANVIISGTNLASAENCFLRLQKESQIKVKLKSISQKKINELARKKFNKSYCHVCKICDGTNCSSGVPGMGGTDAMKSFYDNSAALGEIQINYPRNIISGISSPDLSTNFMGKKLPIPVLNAPVTGSITNMGGSITEYDLAVESSMGLRELGLPALFGDGASPDKHFIGVEAIRQSGGGYLVVKPRKDNNEIIRKILDAEEVGANGWGMDIDAVNLVTMQLKNQAMAAKTSADLKEISSHSKLPFFLKGIMSVDAALMSIDAGAAAIVVSNHGGRIDDTLPGAARVLEKIAETVKKRCPEMTVFADGGIRSGEDIFKILSLGADGVLVGRPVCIAVIACGRLGAYSVLKNYSHELMQIMQKTGIQKIKDIYKNKNLALTETLI